MIAIAEQIKLFLQEDIGTGDITVAIIPESCHAHAKLLTREPMVLCGRQWFDTVFAQIHADIEITWQFEEGDYLQADSELCQLTGPASSILTGERTALNLLQTLSAVATEARKFALAVTGTNCKILDTRKTIPGLRLAQKYAVKCGGCMNHRIGLYDGILIKENHIIAAGSISIAVQLSRQFRHVTITVEVEDFDQLELAMLAAPDRIMLDNFSLADMATAVSMNSGSIELEASGNINLASISKIAATGVDYISVGALTKNIQAIDLSMRIDLVE